MFTLARYWWVVALRGLASLIFGVLALIWTREAIEVLVILFGAYALVDGIFALAAAVSGRAHNLGGPWLEALVGIAAGAVALIRPDVAALALVYFIGGWAVVTGVLEVVAAARLRHYVEGEVWLALAGVVSVLFGILVFLNPGAGAFAIAWMIGVFAIVFGVVLLSLAFSLRRFHRRFGESPRHFPTGGTAARMG